MSSASSLPSASARGASFHTTRWSVVLAAQGRMTGDALASLETLCRQYWRPLYGFIRQRGHSPHDAQDLTQEFFARLLARDWLDAADRGKGRFRSFLLMALQRFLANEWDRQRAAKRGAGALVISLDAEAAEAWYAQGALSTLPAEPAFDRRWALALLDAVMRRLRDECPEHFDVLKPCLTSERGELRYDELAAALGVTADLARTRVHRLRKRFREIFREEVASTVAGPAEVEDEIRAIIAALARD